MDETYVKVAGRWVYLYRAIDQFGRVIDVLVSQKRDLVAADPGDLTTRRSTDLACLGFAECNNAAGSARREYSRGSGGFTRLNLKAGYCTG